MFLIELHGRLGNTAMFYTIAMVLWSFWRFFRKQGPESNYWGALVIAEIVFVIKVVLGGIIWIGGAGEVENIAMHALYGILSLLLIPGMFIYSRGNETPRTMLIFALVLIAQAALIWRGMVTA
jgi:hypothetical protein